MINILLNGCNGKMGQTVTSCVNSRDDVKIAVGVDPNGVQLNDYPVYKSFSNIKQDFDVIIDFSSADSIENVLNYALKFKKPLLIATTGHNQSQTAKIKKSSRTIPILFSANMSLGVSLLSSLVKTAALALGDDYDIEIIEKHHNQKIDAPSGTALALANAVNSVFDDKFDYVYDRHSLKSKRTKKEIGIHSIRGGTIAGEHSVIFAGNDEIIEIKHTALSKKVFAEGAVKSAVLLASKGPGLYSVSDILL